MSAKALRRAIAALEKRQFSRALAPLLEVWETTRSPRIAAAIDRASARFTRAALPVGGSLQTKHQRWLELAATRDPADVPRLLAALTNGTMEHALERLALLRPDPRIASALLQLLATPPYGEPFVARATELAAASANDERRAFTDDEVPHLGVLDSLLDGSGDDLLAAIRADPADDGRRAVYADWLLEQNDPHGELINLQLAGAGSSREAQLIRKLERMLVGPAIAKVTREREIRRGFLDHVVIAKATARALAAAAAAPEWLTVQSIEIASTIAPAWFAAPNLRNLRRLRGANHAIATYLSQEGPLALDTLGLDADPGYLASFVAEPGHLVGLTTLAFEGTTVPFPELATSPLRLHRLEVVTMLSHVGRWLAAIAGTTITEVSITNEPRIYALRDPGGPWTIDIPGVDWNAALAGNLAAGLAGLDATVTIARTDARYQVHVEKALAPLGDRIRYVAPSRR